MGKFSAGMLVFLIGALGMVSAAGAAEIPPTEECSKLNKELNLAYFAALQGNVSAKKLKRADRELAEKLAEAGCISDATGASSGETPSQRWPGGTRA